MKAWIRMMIWQLISRPIVRAVDWSPEERNAFDLFCRSSCGVKLFEFLRQIVANTTFSAVYRESVSANAHARGMQDLLAVLHRLRVFPPLEESSSLEDSEPAPPTRGNVKRADDWRGFTGGRGAIG